MKPEAMDDKGGPGLHGEISQWIGACERYWRPAFDKIRAGRKLVWGREVGDDDMDREMGDILVNHLHITIQGLMPAVYAKNPEISVTPADGVPAEELPAIKGLCGALEIVLNRSFRRAGLKRVAKGCVRGALTGKLAWCKVVFQREYADDPIVRNRIEDAQDNVLKLEQLIAKLDDPAQLADAQAKKEELENLLTSLQEQVDVPIRSGLVLDRIAPEHILLDPAIQSLDDWRKGRRVTQIVYMPRTKAEQLFRDVRLDGAETYTWKEVAEDDTPDEGRRTKMDDDPMVKVYETWDRETQTVYTTIKGVREFVREPYQPENTPEQWYPFHELAFHVVDGRVMPLSLPDLLRELQEEYNRARTQQAEHRDLSVPTWVTDKRTDRDTIERFRDAVLGEVVVVDAQGRALKEVIEPVQPPPWNPMIYDVAQIQRDIDMTSGLPDAQRAAVTRAKTLGEAEIMQQGLATRVGEMQDTIEDWIESIAKASAEVLLLEMTPREVADVAGPEAAMHWPTLRRSEIYNRLDIEIRAGTTGKPDKMKMVQQWTQILPLITQLQDQIMMMRAQGMDPTPKIELLRETLRRMDEKIDLEKLLPTEVNGQQQAGMNGVAGVQPLVAGQQAIGGGNVG